MSGLATESDAVAEAHGARPLAWYVTEPAENTFAALPVRTDVSVLVSLTAFDDQEHHRAFGTGHTARGAVSSSQLRLAPTSRSQLR